MAVVAKQNAKLLLHAANMRLYLKLKKRPIGSFALLNTQPRDFSFSVHLDYLPKKEKNVNVNISDKNDCNICRISTL
jgi:hypothetical protein